MRPGRYWRSAVRLDARAGRLVNANADAGGSRWVDGRWRVRTGGPPSLQRSEQSAGFQAIRVAGQRIVKPVRPSGVSSAT